MKVFLPRRLMFGVCVLALLTGMTPGVRSQQAGAQRADRKQISNAAKESRDAAKVLNEIMDAPDNAIPQDLLDKAEAIAVFPGVVQAAFIVGGRGGDGCISRRTSSGWSAPAFFNLGGGSFGAQIGASKTDVVMLFMNDGALRGLLEDKFEMGGEASVAAGPVGRTAGASTNLTLDAGILTYSRSRGAFAGVALKGVVISPDDKLNEGVYLMKARELLSGAGTTSFAPSLDGALVFPQTLARYTPQRSIDRKAARQ